MLDLLGTITGGMTSTPGLAAADSMTDSNIPSVAYATVYPIAMVFLILFIQIIATMFNKYLLFQQKSPKFAYTINSS